MVPVFLNSLERISPPPLSFDGVKQSDFYE